MPFTLEQFLDLFALYNLAVWPLQIVLVVLAVAATMLAFDPANSASRMIAALLAVLWLWAGVVYHGLFFSRINRAAYLFAALFLVQAMLLLWFGVKKQAMQFRANPSSVGIFGGVCIVYALVLYPLLGQWQGHLFPRAPSFGAPCPVVIFTFGVLLWTTGRIRFLILAIPLLWALIGTSAALKLEMREDFGLPVTGMITVFVWYQQNAQIKRKALLAMTAPAAPPLPKTHG